MKSLSISYKTIKWLFLCALAVLLIPLLLLGRYAVPAADDFSYGAPAHVAYVESGSLAAAASAALGKTAESYFSWQGTFSAIFLMALQPAVFSETLYALTPLIMLAALLSGSFIFCRALFGELMGLERELCDIIAAVLSMLSTQLLPSPVQGLYWFNGSVYYVFFHGLLLMACAAGIRLVLRGGGLRAALLCLMCFIIGGSNYVTALTAAILMISAMALLLLTKNSRWKRLILPALALLAAFALSIAAPGNAVRQAAQENTPDAFAAVLMSFQAAAGYVLEWFSLPVAGMLIMLALIMWKPLGSCGFAFRLPALLSIFSLCLFAAMFCPPIYALGDAGDKRLLNIIYFAYLLLLVINLCYWLGWLHRRIKAPAPSSGKAAFASVAAAAVIFLGCCGGAMVTGTGFSSVAALSSLSSGEAQAYHACAQRRFELLNDESVKDAHLERFPCLPYMLYFDDITEDPADWRNQDMSSFYQKDSVVLD